MTELPFEAGVGKEEVRIESDILPIPGQAISRVGEQYLFASDLDYTNVCPARVVDRPTRAHVRASIDGAGLEQVMHREDLARFMVDQLTSDEWLRKCVAIGY